jgi:hypothetical protein
MRDNRPAPWMAFGVLLLLAACLAACSGPRSHSKAPVRRVQSGRISGIETLAREARKVGDEDFDKVRAVLSDESNSAPKHFVIRFRERLWIPLQGPTTGYARRLLVRWRSSDGSKTIALLDQQRIDLNAELLLRAPEHLPRVLRHEMTHLFQDYASGVPAYWREGIADFVAFSLSGETARDCLRCSAAFPHYDAGYRCAAALLRFIQDRYAVDVVPRLHNRLRKTADTDDFFLELTGKSLEELWSEFQETDRFTPEARIALQLREKEKAPDHRLEVAKVFTSFLTARPGGAITIDAIHHLHDRSPPVICPVRAKDLSTLGSSVTNSINPTLFPLKGRCIFFQRTEKIGSITRSPKSRKQPNGSC